MILEEEHEASRPLRSDQTSAAEAEFIAACVFSGHFSRRAEGRAAGETAQISFEGGSTALRDPGFPSVLSVICFLAAFLPSLTA